MTSGGRPKLDGGHAGKRFSLDATTLGMLSDAERKGKVMSHVVEKCVQTMAQQFDPGPACSTVSKIVECVEEELGRAHAAKDFARVQALAQLRNDLEPYAAICELTPSSKAGRSAAV